MNEFQATAVVVALFALRCVVPFVLVLGIGYGMKRLVGYWEKEEAAQPQARPAIPLPMAARPAVKSSMPALPCWILNNCDEKTRNICPAYASPSLACWVARFRADGKVPAKCAGCELYTGSLAPAAGD